VWKDQQRKTKMNKTFNELNQWLLQNWTAARQLEDSMNKVQEKYKTVCERVIEAVQGERPELDNCRVHFKQGDGSLSFAKKKWLTQYGTWPSGLWIGNMSLDELMADETDAPCASIWLWVPKGTNLDLEEARTKIENAGGEFMKGEKLKCFFKEESEREKNKKTCFWYNIPESRKELTQMLLDEESEKFVECIASHVMILARFIPVLDQILLTERP